MNCVRYTKKLVKKCLTCGAQHVEGQSAKSRTKHRKWLEKNPGGNSHSYAGEWGRAEAAARRALEGAERRIERFGRPRGAGFENP